MKENTLESKTVFEGKVIRVHVDKVKLPNGKIGEREIVDRMDGVSILPIRDDEKALLIKQYRHAHNQIVWRLPGGGIEGGIQSPIETPEESAQRELYEELGYKAKNLDLLFVSGGSGTINQKVHHYLATGLYKPQEPRKKDEEEFLEIYPTDMKKAVSMAKRTEFPNPAFSLMILMAEDKLKEK